MSSVRESELTVTFDAWNRVHAMGVDWCPWCGEPDTDGEFCDAECQHAYWADVKDSGIDAT